MSARDCDLTYCSSEKLLTGMYTMKPRLSRSKESDRVRGDCGEPASTTTSVFAPPSAERFARRLLLWDLLFRHMRNAPVPRNVAMAAASALFREIQSVTCSRTFAGAIEKSVGGGGSGAGGFIDSGSQEDDWIVSRDSSATKSIRLSINSTISPPCLLTLLGTEESYVPDIST